MNWGHVRKTTKVLEKRSTACHLISAPQRMVTFFSKNIGWDTGNLKEFYFLNRFCITLILG